MKTVKFDVTYKEEAGRLELFIRWLWAIPTYIVAFVLEIIGILCMMLQWLHILILGKRNKALHDWIVKFMAYMVKFMSYFYLITDERNPLMPED